MNSPLFPLLASLLLILPSLCATPAGPSVPTAPAACVVIEDGGTGPHKAIATEESGLPGITIFRPRDLAPFTGDSRLPVLLWGNGACANTAQEHRNFLNELASHGYLVLAIGLLDQLEVRTDRSRQATHSGQLTQALDWALAEVRRPGGAYEGRIETAKIGVMGMSCGGLQALEIAGDPRIRTIVVCNSGILPTPGPLKGMPPLTKEHLRKLHSPVLYIMGGASDIAYGNAMDDFARIDQVPVVMTNLDVGHGGTYAQPHGGEFTKVALSWLDWQLKGRTQNTRVFLGEACELAKEGKWTVASKNFPASEDSAPESSLRTEFVYEAIVEIGAPVVLGKTASGHRQYIPITGGSFQGAKLRGSVLPGGADWQTSRPDGVTEVDALYSMKCDDGTVIVVHNSGVITGDGGFYARTAPRFQVQEGPHAWLTRAQFVGSVSGGPRPGTVSIKVFRVL